VIYLQLVTIRFTKCGNPLIETLQVVFKYKILLIYLHLELA